MANSPPIQPTQLNSSESVRPEATLRHFIEDHSKLVTSLAAFVALTAFSSQLDNSDLKFGFAALAFFAALLLGLELESALPDRPRHWRLEFFSFVLLFLVVIMGWYWFSKFPVLWVPALFYLMLSVVLLVLAALLTYVLTQTLKFITTKLLKREIQANVMLRASRIVFVFCAVLVVVGLSWTSRKLAAHPITIHIPEVSTKPDVNATSEGHYDD